MAAKAGPVGAYCNYQNGTWPATVTSQALAWALWESQTGTTPQACKIFYFGLSQFPAAMDFQTTAAAALGIKAVVCCKPDYSSTASMTRDLASFTTMVNMFKAGGLTGYIVLWQEPQNQGKTPANPTGPQYVNLLQFDPGGTGIGGFHAAANAAGFQLVYDAASHTPSAWASYFPGGAYLDAVAVDYYCDTYLAGIRIHGTGSIMDIADGAGLPFGVFEIGVTAGGTNSQPTQAQMASYLAYLTQIMGWNAAATLPAPNGPLPAGRLNRGLANAPVMWWNGVAAQTLNQIVPTATATYAQAAYCAHTGYPALWQALQPQSPATAVPTPAIPGMAQPGTFTPGLQGTWQPLEPLSTPAIPGMAQPGTFTPGDPGNQSLPPPPPPGPAYTAATPGQAVPGLFTPGWPGTAIPSPAGQPYIVQQMSGTATYNYGWSTAEFSGNSAGNMLVVVAAWDLNATGTTAPMPAVYVSDSSGTNYWYHAGTTSADNTGSRCAVWVAPNAQPVDWVSVSPTTFASSLAYVILEVGNAPQWFSVDLAETDSASGVTALSADPGLTGSADIGFAVLAAGSTSTTLLSPPAGWVSLGQVQAGAAQPNGITLWPFWQPVVAPGTDTDASYAVSAAAPLSAVTVLIEAAPYPPLQDDPGMPQVLVEAAFGFLPGDPSQSPPQWTDITSRCSSKDGSPYIQPALGKSYELASPETGELLISCDNHDGAFTPGNTASPYAPGTGVVLGTPVRVSAYWDGSWYHVAAGNVERWPQEWPDMPHWGMSAMIAADAWSALAAATSYSALNGDMLLDGPAVLIPCNEQYTTQQNSLNTFVTSSECQGLLAANISRTNQRPGTYVDGTGAPCATGQSTTLLGSQDTGFGTSSFTAPLTLTSSGPGMVYWDPALPSPLSPSGLTVEFWLSITLPSPSANTQPTVFTAFSSASNYHTGSPSLQIQVQNYTGNNQLLVTFANGTTMTAPFAPSPNPQQVALVFSPSVASLYVNGALAASQALSAGQAGAWSACMLGCGNYAYHCGTLVGGAFTAMSLAIYAYQLPLQRIVSHYVTGVSGQQGTDATTRIAQVLSWAGLGIPRGGRVTFNGVAAPVLQGPAYSLAGSNVSTAVNQAAANEAGMAFTAPDGTLTFLHRWALFNQAPALVFGDNTAAGEIPFQPGQAFDYDNTYLANVQKVTQAQGPTTGITVTAANPASQAAYYTRNPQQTGIQTMSNLDAYDLANANLAAYSQPQLRLRGLTVDAAANPSVAFPGVLALQQGNAATVNRRPVGGAAISANVIVQKVSHDIGPKLWRTSFEMSPYPPLNAVLQLDAPNFNVVGGNSLP